MGRLCNAFEKVNDNVLQLESSAHAKVVNVTRVAVALKHLSRTAATLQKGVADPQRHMQALACPVLDLAMERVAAVFDDRVHVMLQAANCQRASFIIATACTVIMARETNV